MTWSPPRASRSSRRRPSLNSAGRRRPWIYALTARTPTSTSAGCARRFIRTRTPATRSCARSKTRTRSRPMNRTTQITQAEYSAFQTAYDFFNAELFSGTLPAVLITLQRHSKAYGFLAPKKFVGRSDETATHELALNPDHFGRTDEAILSTLAHEMAHVWHVTHGTPTRKR